MNKNQILDQLTEQLVKGLITGEDVQKVLQKTSAPSSDKKANANVGDKLINIFYSIGALIVITGVIILLAKNWDVLNYWSRVSVTLGLAGLAFIGAMLSSTYSAHTSSSSLNSSPASVPSALLLYMQQKKLGEVLFLIAGVLFPIGVYVAFDKLPFTVSVQIYIALALFIVFAIGHYISKSVITFIFSGAYFAWAYFAFIDVYIVKTLGGSEYFTTMVKWLIIVLGMAYILVGYWADKREDKMTGKLVKGIFTFFGTLGVLIPAITFPYPLEIFTVIFVIGAIYGSILLKSRGMSFLGFLFLIIYIIKLTVRYFATSLGWPIALIIIGLLIIAIAYSAVKFNDKFLRKKV